MWPQAATASPTARTSAPSWREGGGGTSRTATGTAAREEGGRRNREGIAFDLAIVGNNNGSIWTIGFRARTLRQLP